MSFWSDVTVYRKCPEIRSEIRQFYTVKVAGMLTMVVFSPLILVGLISIAVVHVFDYIGQYALWIPHRITDWLFEYQRTQIRGAHAKLPVEKIQERTGRNVD